MVLPVALSVHKETCESIEFCSSVFRGYRMHARRRAGCPLGDESARNQSSSFLLVCGGISDDTKLGSSAPAYFEGHQICWVQLSRGNPAFPGRALRNRRAASVQRWPMDEPAVAGVGRVARYVFWYFVTFRPCDRRRYAGGSKTLLTKRTSPVTPSSRRM